MRYFFILIVISVGCLVPAMTTAQNINQNTQLLPGGVDLIWETDAYTPPFYKGKALYPESGNLRLVAVPHATFGDATELIYTWKVNGRVFGSMSGVGRRVFDFTGSTLGGEPFIVVEVRNQTNGPILGTGSFRASTVEPEIRFYEYDPTLGVLFHQQLSTQTSLSRDEITVEAYPYFMSVSDRREAQYTWLLNTRSASSDPRLTLRRGEESGSAFLSLSVVAPNKILQRAQKTLQLSF